MALYCITFGDIPQPSIMDDGNHMATFWHMA